jgi:hypothetical protein
MSKISLIQRAAPSGDVLFQQLGGEGVLLDLASESYFGLNGVGTRVWVLLNEDPGLQRVFDLLCSEYDADPARIEADLISLVERMAAAGLVTVS